MGADGPASLLMFNNLGAWSWTEEMGAVTALSLPEDARSPVPSPQGDRVAYTVEPEGGVVELWIMDADGAGRRQLAIVSIGDYLGASPEYVIDAALSYRWIAERNLLAYEIVPVLGALGIPPLETMMVADVTSGQTWTLVPGGEFFEVVNHPYGDQVAALSGEKVQLIDVMTGAVQHEVTLPLNDFWFSADYTPDGDSLAVFTQDGVALIDTATGDLQNIFLAYEPIGMGEYALMPPIYWLPDSHTFYTVVAEGDDAGDILSPQTQFTVWRVDVATATVERLQTYQGSLVSVAFSPDRQHLAFWSQRQDNIRTLYLADLASGEQVAYDRRPLLEFLNWHPDSAQFVYWEFVEQSPLLGHVCEQPEPLTAVNIPFAGAIYWLGPERYVSVEGVDRGDEVTGSWEIHLRSGDGKDQLLHTVEGAAPRVQVVAVP